MKREWKGEGPAECVILVFVTDSFGAVLEDNVSHTHGIYPCTPSLFVLIVSFLSHFRILVSRGTYAPVVGVGIQTNQLTRPPKDGCRFRCILCAVGRVKADRRGPKGHTGLAGWGLEGQVCPTCNVHQGDVSGCGCLRWRDSPPDPCAGRSRRFVLAQWRDPTIDW